MTLPFKRVSLAIALATILMGQAFADTFVVNKIQINGLQRVSQGTVLNYLPVQVGESFDTDDTPQVIAALYKTNFFSSITLEREGNTLVVNVEERPTIGAIRISGNKLITTKDLLKALSGLNVASGQVYDQSVIDGIQQSLEREYFQQGNYNAQIKIVATPASSNRIDVQITINEGPGTTIKKIQIIGATAFKEKKLVKMFKLKTKGLISGFTKADQYSKEKLDADLETLKSFYMDHGYVQFKIDSTQVTMTPDKKDVYIIIHITEGAQYKISGYKFDGTLLYPEEDLAKLVTLKPGEMFSRRVVTANTTRLGNYYGDHGYAFAKVQPIPQIDEAKHEVMMTFLIDPGSKVYVRRINFEGNAKTQDVVLRREMRQQEGALVSLTNIHESERRLNMLGYFKGVKVDTVPVPGSNDQVDLDVKVTEAPSASLTAGVGYSDSNGLLLNAGYSQPNFLGTGKNLGVSFNTSEFQRYYNISFYNPYYTDSGIGRGFNLYASTTNTDHGNIDISTYAMDNFGASLTYSMPLSDTDSLSYGYGYELTRVKLGNDPSQELINFFNGTNQIPLAPGVEAKDNSQNFGNVDLNGSWSHITYDRGIFPTRGFGQSLGAQLYVPGGGEPQTFYKINYLAHLYIPIYSGFIFSTSGAFGYGDGMFNTHGLPFYRNYYAGGIGITGQVRGYDGYSVGPQDSNGKSYGGNALASGSFALIVPTPIAPDSFRFSTFIDFGNVYNTDGIRTTEGSGPMRFSAGIQAEWRSPIGPLILSFAEPLNAQPQDRRQVLQFTVGTSF